MALTYGFFDSDSGDRVYTAKQFGAVFSGIITDGVFADIGNAFTILESSGMTIAIEPGKAWFEDHWIYSDSNLLRTVAAAHATLDRIDAVVIKVDESTAVRSCSITIVAGTPSATPVAPTLATGPLVFEFKIGEIYVNAAVTEIVQNDITYTVGLPGSADFVKSIDTDDLVALTARVTSNEGDISDLLGDVATNTVAISTLQGDLALKANNTLNNLTNVAINATLNPDADSTRSIGNASERWLNIHIDKAQFPEQAAPSNPAPGNVYIYAKTDGLLYSKDVSGTEVLLSGGAGGGGGDPLTTKGDIFTFDTDAQRLPVGTDGQFLSADSAEATGLKWVAAPSGTSPLTTKGDLFGYSTVNARIPVGEDGQVLMADAAQSVGVKWGSPAVGGSVSMFVNRETPSGTINGSNVTFTLASTPIDGSEMIFRDGQLMQEGASNDYTISGTTITFNTAPVTGTVLAVTYQTLDTVGLSGHMSHNLIKNFPSIEGADGAAPLWWETVGTVTLTEEDATGESLTGATPNERVLKVVTGQVNSVIQQQWAPANERLLKASNTRVSLGVWVYLTSTPSGSGLRVQIADSVAGDIVSQYVTATGWQYVEFKNVLIGANSLRFRLVHSDSGATYYFTNPQLNTGPAVAPWSARGLTPRFGNASAVTGVDPTDANWADADFTSLTSPNTAMLTVRGVYKNSTAAGKELFVRPNGNTGTGVTICTAQLTTVYVRGIATMYCDDSQIIEYRVSLGTGETEDVHIALGGTYWEWE